MKEMKVKIRNANGASVLICWEGGSWAIDPEFLTLPKNSILEDGDYKLSIKHAKIIKDDHEWRFPFASHFDPVYRGSGARVSRVIVDKVLEKKTERRPNHYSVPTTGGYTISATDWVTYGNVWSTYEYS